MAPAPSSPKLLYRIAEAAELVGVSRSRMFELLAAGDITSVRIGRSRLIPAEALTAFVSRLIDQQVAEIPGPQEAA